MAYALFPFAVLTLLLGVLYQSRQQNEQVPGAGPLALAEQLSRVQTTQAQVYAAACRETAVRNAAVVSPDWQVSLPTGVLPIAGARCETTAASDGRMVVASMPDAPGVASGLMAALDASATWSRVVAEGQAVVLANAQRISVPTEVPVGSLVYQIRVSP
ncbi:hypothetical protein [Burkholderia gladioli]|uniref:hypothetical protein n=1 Tax=Burkholderia gladioli TaxID=28095 RepID=UPI000BBD173E|nr:hypothetical protein [Burkholderia gladioli]ATF90525.1 hypothetical protein CO712_36185 [Burkholderia gladioli pv. gladioli]MBJ9711323.1 hypothetical protein [Burkholderia gladioli]MDN7499597.1 hypothetical protein [Burkholderia gladioli]MDR8086141.1 hypothetical protein [Burkholderia gladioli]MDZ4041443.1 hypothetical protein [Burkholderia gladioli pv. alliicola]